MADTRWSARIVLAVGVALGVVDLVVLPLAQPSQVGLATAVYTRAAEALLAGGEFYAVEPAGLPGYRFVYPPVVALAFVPYGLLGDPWIAFAVQTAINVAAGLALARLLSRVIRDAGLGLERTDRALVAAFCVLSTHSAVTMVNGQVNLLLGLCIAGGLVALERGREWVAGAALAVAATVKLFPALLGAYLLRRGDWRAVVAATVTGVGLLVLGVLVLGVEPLETFLTVTLPDEMQTGALANDPTSVSYVTIRRQLAGLLPGLDPALLPILGFAVLAPVVAVHYRRVDTRVERLVAVQGTLVATLLWLPTEPIYFPIVYYPFVPLLYLLDAGRARTILLAGALVTYVRITPWTVDSLLDAVRLSPGVESAVVDASDAVFGVILPSTVGMWLLLAAGVVYQLRDTESNAQGQ